MFIQIKNLQIENKLQIVALCNILDSFKEGFHFIWIPKNDILSIKSSPNISSLSSSQLSSLDELLHDIGDDGHQYINILDIILEIDFQLESDDFIVAGKNLVASYKKFFSSRNLRETILLTENLDDGKFYEKIAQLLFIRFNLLDHRLCLQMKKMSGGGNTTSQTFENESKNDGPLLLAILDSDKTHPQQTNCGDTAQAVLNKHRNTQNANSKIYVLPVRAIENLMPYNILKEIHSGKNLGLVFREENEEYKKYIKCKSQHKKGSPFSENVGILLKEVSESYCNNSQLRSFWIPFAEKYKSSPSGELVCLDLHKSLPKGFLESCIDVLEDNTLIQNQLVLDERGPWNEVAKILFSWTFSYKVNTR